MSEQTSKDKVLADLASVGFSDLEASVYLALVQMRDAATAYEIAKSANIPVANTYNVMRGLVKKRRGATSWRQACALRGYPCRHVLFQDGAEHQDALRLSRRELPLAQPRALEGICRIAERRRDRRGADTEHVRCGTGPDSHQGAAWPVYEADRRAERGDHPRGSLLPYLLRKAARTSRRRRDALAT
ncbi:hypothetical protein CLG85_010825 [Yangia mangrovi]|uniref:Transcription regulator TrmB N-terminal domain-containing protein n=1 Tax=Alloyangia mangrovi TaxID=1779329 RepID=A0ABT2KN54_9RHOB|nr:hypothetical protein [Alloyangia mangrovi]